VNRYSETPGLDRDAITAAARHLVRTEGLKALTMRRLGRELGVEAMSLYHHIADKRDLEVTLVTGILQEVSSTGLQTSGTPVDACGDFARSLRSVLLRHLDLVPLVMTVPAVQLRANAPGERALELLVRSGFDPESAVWIVDAIAGFVLGQAGVVATADASSASHHDAVFETGLRFMLAGLREELGWDA
jgi:AcrR family transcriptional regulator